MSALRVTVWNEFRHERSRDDVRAVYPDGIHAVLAAALGEAGLEARTATLDEPRHGLGDDVLAQTDVLVWWGHGAHDEVKDEVVDAVQARVLAGMGLVALHSAHFSKPFKRLLGTTCNLKWREAGERERLWVVAPGHPIVAGLGECFVVEPEEMYGELFDVPPPDELVLLSWFRGGEVFRSGCVWRRGAGKVVYLRPGHETYPTYFDANVRRLVVNGVRYAAADQPFALRFGNAQPLEPL